MRPHDDRYEILEHLGQGGMATVDLACDLDTGGLVALKRLLPDRRGDALDRHYFRQEADILSGLEVDGIPRFHGRGEVDGRPYLAMEFVDGKTLGDRIEQGGLDWADAADLLAGLALRLDALHSAGFVHRDVKPSNILVDAKDRVWLIDFGISNVAHSRVRPEEERYVLGTPGYLAPERVDAAPDPLDPRSDIYSLGVILYQILCRRLPFDGGSETQLLCRLDRLDPIPPHEIDLALPRDVSEVALRALARSPRQRHRSARDFAAALYEILVPRAARRFERSLDRVAA